MRLLFIAPFGTCRKQTVPRRMLPLAWGLAGAGHVVEALIPAWDCPRLAGRVQQAGGVTVRTPRLGPAPHRLLDPALVRRMLLAADAFRPDLVHVFKPIGYSGVLAVLLQRRGYRVVVDVDDLETEAGWGQHRRWGLRQLIERQERSVLRRAAGVSVASRYLQERVAGIRNQRCFYLPNGLDRASEPAPVAFNSPIVLLYTRGNDVSAARVARLWSAILQKAPQASLRIVGDWPDAPQNLPRCERLGWLEGEALTAAIRGSALALFPVIDSPLVRAKSPGRLLDCLAHGLPIVTEDVGEYGRLAGSEAAQSAGDDEGLVAATVGLLQNRSARIARAEISWRQAGRHTWPRRVAMLATWYEEVGSRLPGQ